VGNHPSEWTSETMKKLNSLFTLEERGGRANGKCFGGAQILQKLIETNCRRKKPYD